MDNDILGGDGEIVLEVGMTFKDETKLFDFYKQYAYAVGFSVRKRNSKKGNDGVVRFVTFTCSREGRRSSNTNSALRPQPTSQTYCKARISASTYSHGTWRINTVNLQHNHKTSPSKSRLFRCNLELSANVKRKLELNDIAKILLHKSFISVVVEAGGYKNMTCVEKISEIILNKSDSYDLEREMQQRYNLTFHISKHGVQGFTSLCIWMTSLGLGMYFGQIIDVGKLTRSLAML